MVVAAARANPRGEREAVLGERGAEGVPLPCQVVAT